MKIGSSLFAKPMMAGNPVPIGTYSQQFINTPNPNGYIPCDGRAISRLAYPVLFGMFSTYFGIGDGSTTFNLPDFNTGAVDTITYVKALDVVTGFVTDANTLGGQIPDYYTGKGMKNKIINGNFDIWQRGITSILGGYVADRWKLNFGGSTNVQSQQAFTNGQTDVPNNPKYFHRSAITSVAGTSNYSCLIQCIEGVQTSAGKIMTLSFYAKADSAKNMAVEFAQAFGSGGSSSVTGIGVTTIPLGSTWKKYTVTFTMPAIIGTIIGTNDSIWFTFWFEAGSASNSRTNSLGQQSGTFDIAQVQLEEGNIATSFEQRHIQQELALCQRYFWTIRNSNQYGALLPGVYIGLSNSPTFNCMVTSPVLMRATPTLSMFGTLCIDVGVPDTLVSITAGRTSNPSRLEVWVTSATSRSNVSGSLSNYISTLSGLNWDAEL